MGMERKSELEIHYAFPYNIGGYRIEFKPMRPQIIVRYMSGGDAKVVITPKQRRRLEEVFGEKGAAIVILHIDELDETFGSAAIVIRGLLAEEQDEKREG
jgi:regulator of protease activity HflC (stomatin/prohibitin superfamily)